MGKFKNKYRSESHRRPNWDYSANALYFLTLVTQHRVCNLGKIVNDELIPSDFGKIVECEFHKSFDIRKELFLDEFILMPNHLHALVEIKQDVDTDVPAVPQSIPPIGMDTAIVNTVVADWAVEDTVVADTGTATAIDTHLIIKRNKPTRLPKSISSFIAGFKCAVNSKIDDFIDEQQLNIPKYNRKNHFFQVNYHDHIVRNQVEYLQIKNYIIRNPFNWNKDSFNNSIEADTF
jgi:putative transposase